MGFGGSGGGSTTIAGASDAALNNPASNDVLTYDAVTSKWKNAIPTGGSAEPPVWQEITDKPDIRVELYYNNGIAGWPARTVPAGYSGWVIWDSSPYSNAPEPPAAQVGDRWRKYYSP